MLRTAALLVTLTLGLSACSAVTGRPLVTWTDDKGITARVKTRLVSVDVKSLSRVDVDTYESTVYLSGSVDSAETKTSTEAAAQAVEGVRQVVSHLVVRDPTRAAARESDAPSALPVAVVRTHIPAPLVGVTRLEGNRAYDRANRHVATIYSVPMGELGHVEADHFAAARPVSRLTVHAMAADANLPAPHYLLVLWHEPESMPAR